jgi:uncharacterized repeat protein (TIGR03803 family)
MKKKLFTLALLALLSLSTQAQLDTLLTFNGTNGNDPQGSLYSDGTYLYGVTWKGGTHHYGNVFKIKPDGTGYVDLLDFNGTNGKYPQSTLISDGTYLYGTTEAGGANGDGVVFKIKPDGTGYVDILDFAGTTNGANPYGYLVSDGTYLYGTTTAGGANGDGVIFKIKPDGTGYVDLLDFAGTNGASPYGSLISDGTYLYGMTNSGGAIGGGTVFKIKTDGTGFVDLLDFGGAGITNGGDAYGSLYSDGTYLYGMTYAGGAHNDGLLFKIKPDGTGYTDLLDFAGTTNGGSPQGTLISDGTYLYGMTYVGGANHNGTMFKIKPDGTGFVDLVNFDDSDNNGSYPTGDLLLIGGTFYGMAGGGGINGDGTIFKYTEPKGAALNFDGVNDYVSASVFSTLTNNLTLEAAVNWEGSTGANQIIVSNGNTATSGYAIMVDFSNNNKLSVLLGGVTIMQSIKQLAVGTWQMVSLVCNSGTWTLYVDGVPFALTNNTSVANAVSGTFDIGADGSGGENFLGSIDEVRFWNRALCQAEIQNNMTGEVADNATGLLAYYNFNQGLANEDNTAITTLTDSTSNAHNGTLNNFALTGAASNFVTPGAVTTGSLVAAFTNTLSAVATQTNISCYGYTDATASVAVTGVGAPFTYAWSAGGTSTTTNTYTSMSPGNYTCTIGNACGASITQTFTITMPTQLMASVTSGTIACNGGMTTVTVSATGGTTNYGGDYGVSTNATAGSYTYTVIDANNCAATTTLTISQPNILMASSTSGTIACNGGATTVTVSATGGTTTYSNTGTYTVTANSYTYTVIDANQCTATTTITVSQPNAVDASVNVVGGTISANNASATYQWVDCNNSNAPISGATSQSFSPVSSGNYAVVVTEGSCSATSTCTPISTTGIAQNKLANSLQVYPNPFSNQLTIVSSVKTTAMLFDMLGNQIKSFNLEAATQTINVGELAQGMYYLQVDAQKIKIMKQ